MSYYLRLPVKYCTNHFSHIAVGVYVSQNMKNDVYIMLSISLTSTLSKACGEISSISVYHTYR